MKEKIELSSDWGERRVGTEAGHKGSAERGVGYGPCGGPGRWGGGCEEEEISNAVGMSVTKHMMAAKRLGW